MHERHNVYGVEFAYNVSSVLEEFLPFTCIRVRKEPLRLFRHFVYSDAFSWSPQNILFVYNDSFKFSLQF